MSSLELKQDSGSGGYQINTNPRGYLDSELTGKNESTRGWVVPINVSPNEQGSVDVAVAGLHSLVSDSTLIY